jgi:hypothetical protein
VSSPVDYKYLRKEGDSPENKNLNEKRRKK